MSERHRIEKMRGMRLELVEYALTCSDEGFLNIAEEVERIIDDPVRPELLGVKAS